MDILFPQSVLSPEIFSFSFGIHHTQSVIWIHFSYSLEYKNILINFIKARWSQSQKSWYVIDNKYNRLKLGLEAKIVGKEIIAKIHPNNEKAFQDFQNILKLKAYSTNTMRTYSIEFAQLLTIIKHHKAEELTPEKLQSYFLYCINTLQLSENYLHSRINAIKFYYEQVLHREKMFIDIPRPKKPLLLPKALNTDEIKKIIEKTENIKHRLIIKLCYGMGLRVSEIVNLKIEDIDSKNMTVFISRGKGKKDRIVNLPKSLLDELREYYRIYKPKFYLFEGMDNAQYSVRSTQNVFKNAMKKAGISKRVGIHSLRHSYATHLLQYGTDISLIQKLMGHNSIKTTLVYTSVTDKHIAKVESPLDKI